MINELYLLTTVMEQKGVVTESRYPDYQEIPSIKKEAPCIRIVLSGNQVAEVESVDAELGKHLLKFGTKQGTFPCMNLAPLYRIVEKGQKKKLAELLKNPGDEVDIGQIKFWCSRNNWGEKFSKKYYQCMQKVPKRLEDFLQGEAFYPPMERLIHAIQPFLDPQVLHSELERIVFEKLENHIDVELALRILFYSGKEGKAEEDDFGSLSVILDSEELEEDGHSAATIFFTKELNQALWKAEERKESDQSAEEEDAFGIPLGAIEKPMPVVKLAGGFDVSLRTMFRGQPCQQRYGRIENATYPISGEMRRRLQDALAYLSGEKMRGKTWIPVGKNEILFVYPSKKMEWDEAYTPIFGEKNSGNHKASFEKEAEKFSRQIRKPGMDDEETEPERIQIFILKKIDKARTKVVYTRCTTPQELALKIQNWKRASWNLPDLCFGKPETLFPMDIGKVMNRLWRQDGSQELNQYHVRSDFYGTELFFGVSAKNLEQDLQNLSGSCVNMAVCAGNYLKEEAADKKRGLITYQLKETVALAGMLLWWSGKRKEDYMKDYAYLVGQMLQIADSLHELYCFAERKDQMPAQFVGSSIYGAVAECPNRGFSQLGQRMQPYITWAKGHRDRRIVREKKGKEGKNNVYIGPTAGYLLAAYGYVAAETESVSSSKNRLTDYEKIQLFLGYLAALPKSKNIEKEMEGERNEE